MKDRYCTRPWAEWGLVQILNSLLWHKAGSSQFRLELVCCLNESCYPRGKPISFHPAALSVATSWLRQSSPQLFCSICWISCSICWAQNPAILAEAAGGRRAALLKRSETDFSTAHNQTAICPYSCKVGFLVVLTDYAYPDWVIEAIHNLFRPLNLKWWSGLIWQVLLWRTGHCTCVAIMKHLKPDLDLHQAALRLLTMSVPCPCCSRLSPMYMSVQAQCAVCSLGLVEIFLAYMDTDHPHNGTDSLVIIRVYIETNILGILEIQRYQIVSKASLSVSVTKNCYRSGMCWSLKGIDNNLVAAIQFKVCHVTFNITCMLDSRQQIRSAGTWIIYLKSTIHECHIPVLIAQLKIALQTKVWKFPTKHNFTSIPLAPTFQGEEGYMDTRSLATAGFHSFWVCLHPWCGLILAWDPAAVPHSNWKRCCSAEGSYWV